MTTALADRPDRPAGSDWAVETHGLTKRFGDNVAVNDVELLVPRAVPSATSARTAPARPPSSGCSSA